MTKKAPKPWKARYVEPLHVAVEAGLNQLEDEPHDAAYPGPHCRCAGCRYDYGLVQWELGLQAEA